MSILNKDHSEGPSRPVNVAALPASGLAVALTADPAQCEHLARNAGISRVDRFCADLVFRRWRKDGVSVIGCVNAAIVQPSVISLEPVEERVEEEIDLIFVPEGSNLARPRLDDHGEMVLDPEGRDPPEPFVGDTIDAWPIAIEHFLLGINQWPRLEGESLEALADYTETADDLSEKEAQTSPFAVLKKLKQAKDDRHG